MILAQSDILLVEDDPNDVLLIRRAFSRAKLLSSLHIVNDGDSAIDYLAGANQYGDRDLYPLPALILLDLKLPRRSGLEVLEWLKQQPELRRLPVVVLTSSRENIDVNRAYDLNANSYLVKPVAPDSLLEMVKMLDLYWLMLNEKPNAGNG
jgi:CheY-like chemotaxis protein